MALEHGFLEANGIRFHYVEQGAGPLVLLLHGFPEFWYSWRKQLPALADAGYRAVALDMRGYGLTDKPRTGYQIQQLVDDIVAVMHGLGEARAHLVGHDWGGIVAWQAAWRRPDAVRSLIAMNAPHPSAFVQFARRDLRQLLQSSYMLFFQAPRVAEWALTRAGAAAVASMLRRAAKHPEVFTAADVAAYRAAFLRPGAASCSLAYYRAAFRERSAALPSGSIAVPTLVLWGADDPVLKAGMNDRLGEWVKDITIQVIPDCGHWTQQEQPDVVNRAMIAWLRRQPA